MDVNFPYDFIISGHSWSGKPEGIEESTEKYVYDGDIIQYEWSGEQPWDHSGIVVRSIHMFPIYWNPIVAGYSPDVDNYSFSSFDYSDVRFLHIIG